MTARLLSVLLIPLLGAVTAAQVGPASDLNTTLLRLADFDYATRTEAARVIRRAPAADAVPVLTRAAREHPDQFVRYRALVLLTAFNPPGLSDTMRALLGDPNDRVREVVYRWYERNPEPRMVPLLLSAAATEQAEFVRPALVRALAALGSDPQVQKALIAEAGRGLDLFRSAVIEALGEHRAGYAAEAVAAVARTEGPLQDDALRALGRIGGPVARSTLATFANPPLEIVPPLQAALCYIGDACTVRVEILRDTVRSRAATPAVVAAAVRALGDIASNEHAGAAAALVELSGDAPGRQVNQLALAFSAAALRQPAFMLGWLARAPEEARTAAIALLREGFDSLEEDFAEEQFFVVARASYWDSPDGSPERTLAATLIEQLAF